MLKISGIFIVFITTVCLGIKKTYELNIRIKYLKQFRYMFEDLMSEISLKNTPLPQAVEFIGKKYTNKCFLKWSEFMKYTGAETGFVNALKEENYFFLAKDMGVLGCLTNSLGRLDLENQLKRLSNGIISLDAHIAAITSKYDEKRKLYLTGSVLAGIFLILIFM